MADHPPQPGQNNDLGGGAEQNPGNAPGGPADAPAAAAKPTRKRAAAPAAVIDPELLTPAKRGRPAVKHGPAAESRRATDSRYKARKAAQAAGIEVPQNAPVSARESRPSVPGYSRRLVKTHDMVAAALDMPEIRIDRDEARDLEEAVTEYLSMKGIPMRTEHRVTVDLIWCVVAIYGPIVIAVVRRFIFPPAQQQVPYQQPRANPQPAPPMQAPSVDPAPFVPTPPPPGAPRTENPMPGFPETERTVFTDGTTAAGLLFIDPGQGGGLKAI